MSAILSILGMVLSAFIKDLMGSNAEQKLGAEKAENNAQATAIVALEARSNVEPLTADQLLQHNASNDPDFRD